MHRCHLKNIKILFFNFFPVFGIFQSHTEYWIFCTAFPKSPNTKNLGLQYISCERKLKFGNVYCDTKWSCHFMHCAYYIKRYISIKFDIVIVQTKYRDACAHTSEKNWPLQGFLHKRSASIPRARQRLDISNKPCLEIKRQVH